MPSHYCLHSIWRVLRGETDAPCPKTPLADLKNAEAML
jgi:hypothetical protein